MRTYLAVPALLLAVGCSADMSDVPRLSDQDIADDAPAMEVAASPDADDGTGGGLFAALFGVPETPRTPDVEETAEAALAEVEGTEPEAKPRSAAPRESRGFFASLFGAPQPQTGPRVAALPPENRNDAGPGAALESTLEAAPRVSSEIAPGTVLPYGRVARVCDVPRRLMGRKSASFPERRAVHTLYDTDPGGDGPRTFYLTGFSDGCMRQFTASMAMFGSVEMHEQLRYGLPAEVQPYSDTDKAYEKVKRKVCGKSRRQPCGSKIGLLKNDTVFLSIYERFGGNAHWMNLLIHRGQIVAEDQKRSDES